jgi:DNA-binding Xre family transcriptional regulator
MAQRWSINEDIIICQECIKYPGAYSKKGYAEHLAYLLQEAGYEPRSIRSIQHRAYAFEIVRSGRHQEGRQLPYASEQVAEVYKVLLDEKTNKHEEIAACIRELYNPDEETSAGLTNLNPNNTIGYQCTIEYKNTFPMMLQKLLDLRGIKKHQDLCDKIGMSINTFSAIIRGKYPTIKKDSILQICVGLRLCTMQAEELLNSAGYTLSNAIMTDVVIKACIYHQQYNPIAIDRELQEHGAPPLFPNYKPRYYTI